ncbi:MAG: FAD binding domain-containing protein, partial [Actinomycetes bacterium]
MIPSPFDYVAASTVEEAIQALAQAGDDAKILAGGQSLVPVLRLRLAAPTMIVDLNKISELRGVRDDDDAIVVGAMTTHHDVINNPLVREHAAVLA